MHLFILFLHLVGWLAGHLSDLKSTLWHLMHSLCLQMLHCEHFPFVLHLLHFASYERSVYLCDDPHEFTFRLGIRFGLKSPGTCGLNILFGGRTGAKSILISSNLKGVESYLGGPLIPFALSCWVVGCFIKDKSSSFLIFFPRYSSRTFMS